MNTPPIGPLRRCQQAVIMAVARPYISRELPGWGKLYQMLVGDYRNDGFWKGVPETTIRGKVHGYDMHLLLSQWADRSAYFLGRWYELDTQLFMADVISANDTVVDIGANRGMFTLCASHLVGKNGRVMSFEPNPASRAILEREVSHNRIENITVIPMGLSDQKGTLVLNVPKHNSGEASFGNKFQSKGQAYVEVEAKVNRGDEVLADVTPSFIKIDVEGFEVAVIKGLQETLSRHKPVVLAEVIAEHLQICGTSVRALFETFEKLGYEGFRLGLQKANMRYDWAVIKADIHEDSYNAVWLHKDAPAAVRSLFARHLAAPDQKPK